MFGVQVAKGVEDVEDVEDVDCICKLGMEGLELDDDDGSGMFDSEDFVAEVDEDFEVLERLLLALV